MDQACFNYGAGPVFYALAHRISYTEIDADIVRKIIMHYPHAVLVVDGFALWMWTTMYSGVMHTDVIDGVVVWLLICMGFHVMTRLPFREHARLVDQGDDHVGSLSSEAKQAFDPEVLAGILGHWGYRYTNEEKTLDFKDFFKSKAEAKFL